METQTDPYTDGAGFVGRTFDSGKKLNFYISTFLSAG